MTHRDGADRQAAEGLDVSDWTDLLPIRRNLAAALADIDRQIAATRPDPVPRKPNELYRIALRPDDQTADPMDHRTLLDDIVVRDVSMFRAEQMSSDTWWVCCYLDDLEGERICWNVSASARPKRINWTTYEFPEGVAYEHDSRDALPGLGDDAA